jgi:hypothetical protein
MAKKFIQSVVDSPNFRAGAFTRKAHAAGMKPLQFMHRVLAYPHRYDLTTRREAQFLKNIQRV